MALGSLGGSVSATVKWEHKTDSWHLNHRLERKARAAGRLVGVVEAELAADDEASLEAFEQAAADDAWWAEHQRLVA